MIWFEMDYDTIVKIMIVFCTGVFEQRIPYPEVKLWGFIWLLSYLRNGSFMSL